MKLDARLNLFITLVAVFMTCLIVGDMIGGKLTSFQLFGREWIFSVGQIAFPVTFILTDIINEFYGRKVVLKGDDRLTYGDVRRVMEVARKAGAKAISLGIEEIKK